MRPVAIPAASMFSRHSLFYRPCRIPAVPISAVSHSGRPALYRPCRIPAVSIPAVLVAVLAAVLAAVLVAWWPYRYPLTLGTRLEASHGHANGRSWHPRYHVLGLPWPYQAVLPGSGSNPAVFRPCQNLTHSD